MKMENELLNGGWAATHHIEWVIVGVSASNSFDAHIAQGTTEYPIRLTL